MPSFGNFPQVFVDMVIHQQSPVCQEAGSACGGLPRAPSAVGRFWYRRTPVLCYTWYGGGPGLRGRWPREKGPRVSRRKAPSLLFNIGFSYPWLWHEAIEFGIDIDPRSTCGCCRLDWEMAIWFHSPHRLRGNPVQVRHGGRPCRSCHSS